jgi:membrane-associated protein
LDVKQDRLCIKGYDAFQEKALYQAHDFLKNMEHWHYYGEILTCSENFTPIVAGIVKMDKKAFFRDNIIGAVLWSFLLIFAGHYLDKLFMDQFGINLKKKLELIIIVIVLVTTVPVIGKFLFGKKKTFQNMKTMILTKTLNRN